MWLYIAVAGAFILGIILGEVIGRKKAYANFIQLQNFNEQAGKMADKYLKYLTDLKGDQNVK